MTQFEDAASIAEALEKIKEQLKGVTLKTFMLDMNQAEIEAVRKVFPGRCSLKQMKKRILTEIMFDQNERSIKIASNTTAGYVMMYIQNDVMMFKNVI